MGKTKTTSSSKKESKTPLAVSKGSGVTKPSQTPIAKSKKIAKEVASKAVNGKKSKKPVESESESEDSEDSESSESESEVETKAKPATNGKAAKAKAPAKKEESSEEEDSESEEDESEDDSEDDSEDSESEAEAKKPAAKADKKANGKVNGASKKVEAETSDSSESSDEEDSDEESEEGGATVNGKKANGVKKTDDDEEDDDDSDDSEEDSDDSDESEEEEKKVEAPSKKRKADDATEASTKKAKVDAAPVSDDGPKNLFVGNLSWNIDDEWLFREFEEFGDLVGARIVTQKEDGRSRGFGYVEFSTAAAAAAALEGKKGTEIDGRIVNLDFSTPRNNDASGAGAKDRSAQRAKSFGDVASPESDTLWVGNLSFDADENMIGEAFGNVAQVLSIRLPTDPESGRKKGFGYVTFASIEDAKTAYDQLMGAEVAGRPMRLDFAGAKPDRGSDSPRGGGFRGGRGGGRGGPRGGGRGGARGGPRNFSTNRGGFGDFQGKKMTF